MVDGAGFVVFGFLAGFAYLAYARKQQHLAYGLGLVGFGFFLEAFMILIDAASQRGVEGFLSVVRYVSLGGGAAFLGYVAATDGVRLAREWREARRGLRAPSLISAEAPAQVAGRGGSKNASSARATMGSSTTLRDVPP